MEISITQEEALIISGALSLLDKIEENKGLRTLSKKISKQYLEELKKEVKNVR